MEPKKVRVTKADVLKRLDDYHLELCTNFGVSAPTPSSKDKFNVALVVRPELIDAPVTIILKQGVRVSEAVEALDYVAGIIADADKAIVRHTAGHKPKELGYFFWLGVHGKAFLSGLFRFPEHTAAWLIKHVINRSENNTEGRG